MGLIFYFTLTLLTSAVEWGNCQDPNGDSLVCAESLHVNLRIACLAAAVADVNPGADGRPHTTGQVYRTYCTKTPEETWVVNSTGGIQTLRLKSDPTRCLTIDSTAQPSLALCNPANTAQKIVFTPTTPSSLSTAPNYNFFKIAGAKPLFYEEIKNVITKSSDPLLRNGSQCNIWLWASEIEAKAAPYRNTIFSFPIMGPTNPLRDQYTLTYWLGMLHSTAPLPSVTIPNLYNNQSDTCHDCLTFPCNCFPLDYDLTQPTVTTVVTLNPTLRMNIPGYENIAAANRVPAGVFAKPWTTLEFNVPAYDQTKFYLRARLYVLDDARGADNWWRPPLMNVMETLKPGYNRIRSPLGGPLFIELIGRDTTSGPINITVSGGVPMATFILGKTTEADWPAEIAKQPQRIAFLGEHVGGFDLKAPYQTVGYQKVAAMVKRYDLLFKNNYLISGYDLNPSNREDIHAAPQGWYYWTRDSAGGNAHNGNPFTDPDYSDLDINLKFENWRVWMNGHEFGHNLQTPCYSGVFGGETTNNQLSAFHVAYFCGDGLYTMNCSKTNDLEGHWYQYTVPYLGTLTYEQMLTNTPQGMNAVLSFWLQIVSAYGYEALRGMHRRLRERFVDPNDPTCFGDKYGKYDAVYEAFCDSTGVDLTQHFDTWKVTLSDAVRARVAAKNYPKQATDISHIVPKEGTPLTWKTPPPNAPLPFKNIPDAQP